ncbi:hypothetical protein OTERR_13380 [Oryzomicrobium terrae]|uniref:DUF1330 domain-containing protein n=1 Tax=Oryzomicrobium terrae TaxID=1735038 RepID=A0A5C1E867_9RHOO|nr:DUF1330 domain-containing protein [Oryzomicrobium terrae]QEL64814.1 hypothetical protein OTERR_13380 [Oryzomicrobium terrae]
MAAYLMAEAKVTDPDAYETYKRLAQVAIAQYGGRYLVRGGAVDVLEGHWTPPQRLVVVEFPSVEQAKRFYDSPEYRAAREARATAADMNMLVVAGI